MPRINRRSRKATPKAGPLSDPWPRTLSECEFAVAIASLEELVEARAALLNSSSEKPDDKWTAFTVELAINREIQERFSRELESGQLTQERRTIWAGILGSKWVDWHVAAAASAADAPGARAGGAVLEMPAAKAGNQ